MESVFAHLELNTVRYSLVWEDWQTLYNNLDIQPQDHLAIITSAGCNVLNALLKNPKSITAIDLNPVQNNLLQLKLHIIQYHTHNEWRGIMGFGGKDEVRKAWLKIVETLNEKDVAYWNSIIEQNPAGLILAGRLEKYICNYFTTLEHSTKEKIRDLFGFDNTQEQLEYCNNNIFNDKMFRESFSTYFSDENLSRGRDPRLFTYAEEKGEATFFNRLQYFLSNYIARDNFYLRFFFLGAENIPIDILPPCHRPENFDLLKERIHRVQVVDSEAIDYLLSQNGAHINKASLSNIFEYISHADFKEALHSLYVNNRNLQLIYWNLLQHQLPATPRKNLVYNKVALEKTACFYFNNAITVNHTA
ncbi:MAG: DUF3419 family protein [Agriterribacter sp.]